MLLGACRAESPEPTSDELTSLSARGRDLEFEGRFYLEPGASESEPLDRAREQTHSLFGALLHQDVGVNHRELREIDRSTMKMRDVQVVSLDGTKRPMREVRYTYVDRAVVPLAMARRSALPIAVLSTDLSRAEEREAFERAVRDCTKNDEETRDSAEDGFLWYEFDPSRAGCRRAIDAESKRIKADAGGLAEGEVAESEVTRTFLPITLRLSASDTNAKRAVSPEYDRLFAGGVEKGKLKIALLSGRLSHDRVAAFEDGGYYEWLYALYVLKTEHPGLKLQAIEPPVDLSKFEIEGKTFEGLGVDDAIRWHVLQEPLPAGLSATGKKTLLREMGERLEARWLTFDLPVKVTLGGRESDVTVEVRAYFGVEDQPGPYKRGIRENDVFVYNGHSYIGQGPLDPANFVRSDFPASYQILFFDGCVSYNYYHEDYFAKKPEGTLDLVTNGIEAPEEWSGYAEGRFVSELISGRATYRDLLAAAKDTDALRVVDGELDNEFDPKKTPVTVADAR